MIHVYSTNTWRAYGPGQRFFPRILANGKVTYHDPFISYRLGYYGMRMVGQKRILERKDDPMRPYLTLAIDDLGR
jgi:hypothetical protein